MTLQNALRTQVNTRIHLLKQLKFAFLVLAFTTFGAPGNAAGPTPRHTTLIAPSPTPLPTSQPVAVPAPRPPSVTQTSIPRPIRPTNRGAYQVPMPTPQVLPIDLNTKPGININQLIADKKYSEASEILDRLLKTMPTDGKAWYDYGYCRQALKDYHGAIAAYKMCESLSGDPLAKAAAESLKQYLEQEKEAERAAAAVAIEHDNKIQSLIQLNNERKFTEAVTAIGPLIKTDPTNLTIWMQMGRAKEGLADYHGALAAYEMAHRLNPGDLLAEKSAKNIRDFLDGKQAASAEAPGRPTPAPVKLISWIDYEPYWADLTRRIKRAWFPPKGSEAAQTTLKFKILQDGSMSSLQLVTSSGSRFADQSIQKAVENAAPFRPLPNGATSDIDVVLYSGRNSPVNPEEFAIYLKWPSTTGTVYR